jgi:hypothetical protein
MRFSYAWQKAREALTSLTADRPLDERLIAAGRALACFPVEGLPSEERRLASIADQAFTAFPDTWTFSGDEGVIDALIRMLPDERKQDLIGKVVELFDAICTLQGREAVAPASIQASAEVDLDSPDKWEFLFWRVPSSASQEERQHYVRYAQHWLPHFPGDVLLEWFGRHGYDSLRGWAHLPLERLRFEDVSWTLDQLVRIQSIDAAFTAVGPETHGGYHLNRNGDWLGEYIRQNGTWPAPIIVIDHDSPAKVSGYEVPAGLVLVEGHKRLSRMLNVPVEMRAGREHRVMLGRLTGSST